LALVIPKSGRERVGEVSPGEQVVSGFLPDDRAVEGLTGCWWWGTAASVVQTEGASPADDWYRDPRPGAPTGFVDSHQASEPGQDLAVGQTAGPHCFGERGVGMPGQRTLDTAEVVGLNRHPASAGRSWRSSRNSDRISATTRAGAVTVSRSSSANRRRASEVVRVNNFSAWSIATSSRWRVTGLAANRSPSTWFLDPDLMLRIAV
jgi:hypothetical protein